MGKKCKKVWEADPLYLFWTIWRKKNRVSFDNEAFFAQQDEDKPLSVICALGPMCTVLIVIILY